MSNHKIVPGKTRFYAVYADGRPQWEVTRSRGDGVWEAKVVKSLDWEGTVKVFTTEEISKALAWEAFFKKNAKLNLSMIALVKDLRNGYRIAFLSNVDRWRYDYMMKHILNNVQYLFDYKFASFKLGADSITSRDSERSSKS